MRDQRYPFDGMDRFFDQMRREMFGGIGPQSRQFGDSRREAPAIESADQRSWDAGVTVEETDDGFVVLADLPGFDRDELSIRLHDDVLHLSGEHEVGDGMSYRSRQVSERITLPARVDPDHVTASYHNGVLEIQFEVVSEDDAGTDIHIE
ncbi:Hsp20/alpha crystallin family protein [Halomicroarcula sp. F28]|uniref:Hsp20/alpha crystallin family protein n=1 Tax=Haloarcula salinisoli TaxID=2487746 RepID=UPI001C73A07E|nr:Hsp20/alpha crystallin family protein [Halomicroarcula salinisoli]MBX0285824.1 Hsp20/alpha crystallin family protein [Halomicroarcula salinisoli]